MPRITTKELSERRRKFLEEAGRAYDQMLGSDGQNGLVTFAQREDRACELGDGLTRRLLQEHLEVDDAAVPDTEIPCPICGRPVPCEEPEEVEKQSRDVLTRRGKVQYERAARRCRPCRRIFFPPG